MQALVLESTEQLEIRDIDLPTELGPTDLRIDIHTVGICGSDVHYYKHGRAGPNVVREPMVLGHEASGTVSEVGRDVTGFSVGDRVCMEPGIPDPNSRAFRLGKYNVDPAVRFWATPPIHGCLTPSVVHPADFTFRVPDNVSFAEAAMVEPLAVGMQAATKAQIEPGDVAVVLGAGTIGMMIALSALAGGCSRVLITDVHQPKLDIAATYPGITGINLRDSDAADIIQQATEGWGADIVFEASGNEQALLDMTTHVAPGGRVVIVGVPGDQPSIDIGTSIDKELTFKFVFRYANVFDRALKLISSQKIDLKPLISHTFSFFESIQAFERAASGRPEDVKLQIRL